MDQPNRTKQKLTKTLEKWKQQVKKYFCFQFFRDKSWLTTRMKLNILNYDVF